MHLLLCRSASLLALTTAILSGPAIAQTANPPQITDPAQPDATAAAPTARTDDQIIVTGTRIRRRDFSTPSPIVSLGAQTIEQSGTTNLTDLLTRYPALQASSTSTQNAGDQAGVGTTGLNLLNLRNLGTNRTLVLVDGRRHVSGLPGDQAVDINTIPEDLIERVDILTGGESAIYGADAVSGVVNFILKKNFNGLIAHAQAGVSGTGDAPQRLISVTAGHNFADGRGNFAVSYEHSEEDRLKTSDRSYLSGANLVAFELNPASNGQKVAGVPQYVPLQDVRYAGTARQGAIGINSDFLPDYFINGAGQLTPFDQGVTIPGGYQQGGSATSLAAYGNDLLPQIRRDIVNVIGHFDVSPALTIFAEGKYANTRSFSLAQPTFDYYLQLQNDNAYLPPALSALSPNTVEVTRDNFDFGLRGERIKRETLRGVIGARGDLGSHANYEVSYVYGQTKIADAYIGDRITDRYYAALDAVRGPDGQITCRINLDPTAFPNQPYQAGGVNGLYAPVTFQPGQCVPLNILGEGSPSKQALAFITANTLDHSKITQQVLSGSLSGDFGRVFSFPGGGNLGFSLGGEYRRETSDYTPDPLIAQGLTFGNKSSATNGKYSVKEFFAEIRAPLLTDRPFAYALELGAAIRKSDYTPAGKTTSYKVDARWAPVHDISFNSTYSTAVRVPNIGELFGGSAQTFNFIIDPCNSGQQNNGTSYRPANCAALLSGLGADPATYQDMRSVNIAGTQSGNPTLIPETAKTWTAGVILQPSFIRGLILRADWYDINIKNAINQVTAEKLAQLCVDQPTLQNQFCAAITRQQGDNGQTLSGNITGYTIRPQNVASFSTAGLDMNVSYTQQTAHLGTFNLSVIGNYLDKQNFVASPGADLTNIRGESANYAPKYTVTSNLGWNIGQFTFNYEIYYFSKTLRFTNLETTSNPDITSPQYLYLKEHWQHNIYAKVDIAKRFQFYMGVNNLFDQQPAYGTARYPVDAIGRFFYTGVRITLDGHN